MNRLIPLFHRRWIIPVLAELRRADGAKFVTLAHRLGVGQAALRQTLDELLARGWVRRNPGHGHPLRPEYLLTPAGARRAPGCAELHQALDNLRLQTIGLKQWPLPTLFAIGESPRRFSELAIQLKTATDRALALALKELQQAALITRRVLETFPPISAYSVTAAGQTLMPILARV